MLSIILLLLLALLEIKTQKNSRSTRLIGRREPCAPPELVQGAEAAAEVDVDFHGGIGIVVTATDGGGQEGQRRKYSHRSPFCHN